MLLLITIVKSPGSIAVTVPSMSFSAQGGTMGRGDDNTWVLDDPELFLSSLHCEFSFEGGQYYITDRSTNGTFYNGSVDPMGKGIRQAVSNNDHFIIGDYEFSISIQEQSANKGLANDPFSNAGGGIVSSIPGDRLFEPDSSLDNYASGPFDGGQAQGAELFASSASNADPLAALDKAKGRATPLPVEGPPFTSDDLFSSATHSDGANLLNQQVDWPEPIPQSNDAPLNVIPDDWDMDSNDSIEVAHELPMAPVSTAAPVVPETVIPRDESSAKERALEMVNQKLLAEVKALKYQISSSLKVPADGGSVDTTFINALGFSDRNLSYTEINQINQLAGEVMREMISGMMQVLGSRSAIKNEFRMNVTTIQPVENNPLKFSANVDDALENMFLKQGNAFKQPLDAVREGFEGVAEHQVAILAGIREAFKAVIDRFDPITLEERFGKQRGGLLPGSQKAKNWEAYIAYYDELSGDVDKSFQYLFGDGFVRAYEDQLQKLAVSKKSRAKKRDH